MNLFFKLSLVCGMLYMPVAGFAQDVNIDSLVKLAAASSTDTARVNHLITISNKYRVNKIDYKNALRYAELARALAGKSKFAKGVFFSDIALGYVYRDMGEKAQGLKYLNQALLFFESTKALNNTPYYAGNHISTYTALAEMYTQLPDFENARRSAFKGLELAEQYKVQRGLCWITLSIIFSRQKNMADAKKYAQYASDEFKSIHQIPDLARANAFLGSYAFAEKKYPEALEYYQQSYDAYKSVNSLYGMRIALYNQANIYLAMKAYTKSDDFLGQTLAITSEDDNISMFHISQLLFNIKMERQQYSEAIAAGNRSVQFALKTKSPRDANAAYYNLLSVYKAVKDTAGAFLVSEKINTIKDSLYNADLAKSTAELARKYESQKQEEKIALLDHQNLLDKDRLKQQAELYNALASENQLKAQKLEQDLLLREALRKQYDLQKTSLLKENALNRSLHNENKLMIKNSKSELLIRWLLIAFVTASLVFSFIYFRNYKAQRRSNIKITGQAEELKFRMKEVHHRVKNNLQVVGALLRMQARYVKDKEATDVLQISENRLQAIAMVHEKLYKSENLSNIKLVDYLQELAGAIALQYEVAIPSFKCDVRDTAHLIVTIDTAIPLGLIVNELVTNSFKHGFNQREQLSIRVNISKEGGLYRLYYEDNGTGSPKHNSPNDGGKLGMKLIKLFAEQLDGSFKYNVTKPQVSEIIFKPVKS